MITKEFMHSKCLSQAPVLFAPASLALTFATSKAPGHIAERHHFPDKVVREYLKTADLVEAAPWFMVEAAEYLRTLARGNSSCSELHLPDAKELPLGWIHHFPPAPPVSACRHVTSAITIMAPAHRSPP